MIKEGRRPSLQPKERRMLILLQDLLEMCWDKEPEKRPKMSQVVEFIQAPEFEWLRAEVALTKVESISCACVCCIFPEHESNHLSNDPSPSISRDSADIERLELEENKITCDREASYSQIWICARKNYCKYSPTNLGSLDTMLVTIHYCLHMILTCILLPAALSGLLFP